MSETDTAPILSPEEIEKIRIVGLVRRLSTATALGDELRRLRQHAPAFDLTDSVEQTVENLKQTIAKGIVTMKDLAKTGANEHHIQIFISYPKRTLEVFTEAVEELNKKGYYGLRYRIEVSPGVFVVWAEW